MTSTSKASVNGSVQPAGQLSADVCVVGAGLVGLFSALQFAKSGLSVVVVDAQTEAQQADFKVGESLLVFSNAFLRTIGELDEQLSASFVKQGFWMAHGLEGSDTFHNGTHEFGFLAQLPDRWRAEVSNGPLLRAMAGDVQIVRPEIERALRETVGRTAGVTVCDRGLVREVTLGSDGAPHVLTWRSRDGGESGVVRARWVMDCSGRRRLLARQLGLVLPVDDDGFRTASVWAQFGGCPDDVFGPEWTYTLPEGRTVRRDLDTVHLWGTGYWIWIIRLTEGRLSIGVTLDREVFGDPANLREVFWEVIRRYPLLSFLREEAVLQFHAYKDVQYLTRTYVSPQRYALAGDAAAIIDPLYSQGLSLSLSTAWHAANIMRKDVAEGVLDTGYIDRVNAASAADQRLLRSMIKGKYTSAISDGRFFILDHLLDYLFLSAALLPRYQLSRLLTETGGCPKAESAVHRRLRAKLEKTLFLTQLPPMNLLPPATVAQIAERWHAGLAGRARWRQENGISPGPARAVLRADAALPQVWRLPFLHRTPSGELTPKIIVEPRFMRVKGTEVAPPLLVAAGPTVLMVNAACGIYDMADTGLRKLAGRLRPVVQQKVGQAVKHGRVGVQVIRRVPRPVPVAASAPGPAAASQGRARSAAQL